MNRLLCFVNSLRNGLLFGRTVDLRILSIWAFDLDIYWLTAIFCITNSLVYLWLTIAGATGCGLEPLSDISEGLEAPWQRWELVLLTRLDMRCAYGPDGCRAERHQAHRQGKRTQISSYCCVEEVTFSRRSIQAWRSKPKSMKVHWMPSRLYSSCSRINMWWLKNCCSFSFVKLIHSCSKLLNWRQGKELRISTHNRDNEGGRWNIKTLLENRRRRWHVSR